MITSVVTLPEIKKHVRAEFHDDDDLYLGTLADVAVGWSESWLGVTVADLDPIPAQFKHAVLLLVGGWYENRESVAEKAPQEIPFGVEALLLPLRNWA